MKRLRRTDSVDRSRKENFLKGHMEYGGPCEAKGVVATNS